MLHSPETPLLRGKLVRLCAVDAETLSKGFHKWSSNSEYARLLDSGPARPFSQKAIKGFIEKELQKDDPILFFFAIRTIDGDRLIGETGFDGIRWNQADTFIGIGIGEQEFWGKGYGTEAMQLMLRFAFTEINLHRVSLTVFEYNERAIQSYLKCGFQHEGRWRQYILREGRRWDILEMGILRETWMQAQEMEKNS